MKKTLSIIIGCLTAFGLSTLLIFVLGAQTKLTVFGADKTLIFFESFFINIICAIVTEWIQKSDITDMVVDTLASVLMSLILVWYTSQSETEWLSIDNMWKATEVYTAVACTIVLFSGLVSTKLSKKLGE